MRRLRLRRHGAHHQLRHLFSTKTFDEETITEEDILRTNHSTAQLLTAAVKGAAESDSESSLQDFTRFSSQLDDQLSMSRSRPSALVLLQPLALSLGQAAKLLGQREPLTNMALDISKYIANDGLRESHAWTSSIDNNAQDEIQAKTLNQTLKQHRDKCDERQEQQEKQDLQGSLNAASSGIAQMFLHLSRRL